MNSTCMCVCESGVWGHGDVHDSVHVHVCRVDEEGEGTQSGKKKKRVISKAFISDEDSSGEEGKPSGEGVEPGLPSSSPTPRAEDGSSASSQSESEERLVALCLCLLSVTVNLLTTYK